MASNQVEPEQYNSNRPDPFPISTTQVDAESHKVQNKDSEIDDTEFFQRIENEKHNQHKWRLGFRF